MTNLDDKILYLKNLLPEDGIVEVLERLKLMLAKNKQRINEIIQIETQLSKLNNDYRFQFITKEAYNSQYAILTKTVIDYLDELTLEDFDTQNTTSNNKANSGKLLHKIPDTMQFQKRTKCIVRLAHLEAALLENYTMTEDTVIQSIRISEVMEVDLQDRNEEKAFEITTPNNKEQFLDEGYYTEWIYYVKPIKKGKHELTLVISVLEEIRGKERRRDVVLEEAVTIIAEDVVTDSPYKATGYEVGSTKVIQPQSFTRFDFRKYAAVFAFVLFASIGIWAFSTESGQYRMASLQDDKSSYQNFLKKYEGSNSIYTQKASEKVEAITYTEALAAIEDGSTTELLAFVEEYPKSEHANVAVNKLMATEFEQITTVKSNQLEEPLVNFIKRYQHIEAVENKKILERAKVKYQEITNDTISPEVIENSPVKSIRINTIPSDIKKGTEKPVLEIPKDTEVKKPSSNKIPIPQKEIGEISKDKPSINKIPKSSSKTTTFDLFAPQMIRVKGGTFKMGSLEKTNEQPIHTVKLSSFSISKYEVTQKQWRAVMGKDHDTNIKDCDDCPVDNVEWKDAVLFIEKLNKKTGKKYRLPTEAEWEYAAKGGQKSNGHIYAGSTNISSVAWYRKNSQNTTHKVGSKEPNELGLYDMSGNVFEWCSDWYDVNYYKHSPTSNPNNLEEIGFHHVLRGGSWQSATDYCRTTSRFYSVYLKDRKLIGFRLAHD